MGVGFSAFLFVTPSVVIILALCRTRNTVVTSLPFSKFCIVSLLVKKIEALVLPAPLPFQLPGPDGFSFPPSLPAVPSSSNLTTIRNSVTAPPPNPDTISTAMLARPPPSQTVLDAQCKPFRLLQDHLQDRWKIKPGPENAMSRKT